MLQIQSTQDVMTKIELAYHHDNGLSMVHWIRQEYGQHNRENESHMHF